MTYTAFGFYILVFFVLVLYYTMPLRFRWTALLIGSIAFYVLACREGCLVLLITALLSYELGRQIQLFREKYAEKRPRMQRLILCLSLLPVLLPWIWIKNGDFIASGLIHKFGFGWIVPLGISFYTLQIVSYLVDIYRGKRVHREIRPNIFYLFCSFHKSYRGRYRGMNS